VLALVLSGAQADSPGSAGGHIAVATGRLGADGEWADWLVNDVYPVATFGEKGIVSGPVPMDNYLTDLNSGQAMYRPVYVLVAVLGAPAAALDVQATFDEFFPLYWCRAIEYDRATNSSTRLSLDPLRALGWRIPPLGGTSRIKGALAAVVILVATLRPKLAREAWNFFTGERTDIFPRLALRRSRRAARPAPTRWPRSASTAPGSASAGPRGPTPIRSPGRCRSGCTTTAGAGADRAPPALQPGWEGRGSRSGRSGTAAVK
jgi:hypothetical protein